MCVCAQAYQGNAWRPGVRWEAYGFTQGPSFWHLASEIAKKSHGQGPCMDAYRAIVSVRVLGLGLDGTQMGKDITSCEVESKSMR